MIALMRLIVILAIIFCTTKALFVSDTKPRAWSDYDQEHGQYSMEVLSTDTTKLQNQVYVFTLEVNHTMKYIDRQIIALFNEAGTDPAKIASLEEEFKKRGENTLVYTENITNATINLVNLVEAINEDISNNTFSQIAEDQTLLKNQYGNFTIIYALNRENIILTGMLVKNKILITIGFQTGPEMDEINALTLEAEELLLTHGNRCDATKIFVDEAYAVGDAALAQLVATLPNPAN